MGCSSSTVPVLFCAEVNRFRGKGEGSMTGKRKVTGRTSSVPGGLAAGGFISMLATMLITAVLALLLENERMDWDAVGYGIAGMILLSAYLGAVTAWKRIRRQRLMICMMSGLVYWGSLLSVTALFFGGQFEAVGVTVLLIAGGCLCAVMTGAERKRPSGRAGKRKYSR